MHLKQITASVLSKHAVDRYSNRQGHDGGKRNGSQLSKQSSNSQDFSRHSLWICTLSVQYAAKQM
jgi:hypothetical protein